MSAKKEIIQKELDQAVEKEIFPGASLLIARGNDVLCLANSGHTHNGPRSRKIENDTLFDIASLTKPMATATLMMMTSQEMDDLVHQPIGDFFHSTFYSTIHIFCRTCFTLPFKKRKKTFDRYR